MNEKGQVMKIEHYDGKCFHNLDKGLGGAKSLLEVLRWKLLHRPLPWPQWIDDRVQPQIPAEVKENEVFITFINHSSLLIQFKGWNIITDPVFSDGVGPSWGPKVKRIRPPGLTQDDLPPIDLVLVSHNHFDHLDLPSLKELHKRHNPEFIVPLKNRALLESVGITKIKELAWWQEEGGVTLTPAQHWSARGIRDRFHALWGGFFLRSGPLKVFFAGDSGYNTHFQMIKGRLGAVDVALLPIGAYAPRWFMKENHMDPEEAVLAHIDLESKFSLGIHFDTFHISDEGFKEAEKKLKESLAIHGVKKETFLAPLHGQTFHWSK